MITPIDTPDAGVKPIGPSPAVLTAAGFVAGLTFGLGLLFLTVQPVPVPSSTPARDTDTMPEFRSPRRQQTGRSKARGPAYSDALDDSEEPVGSANE